MATTTPMYQVDAFTDRLFAGNPAAVCPLATWLSDETMQAIAAENNLSETAFFVAEQDGFRLRWFTPACEVELCGHATLAAGFVVMELLDRGRRHVEFETASGRLTVARHERGFALDLPSLPPVRAAQDAVAEAVGGRPSEILLASDYLLVYGGEREVLDLAPDMAILAELREGRGAIATAPGEDCDFISRFFAPACGVPEDPVTGSAHCTLTPYWAGRLGRTRLHARQLSARGGELWCEQRGDRVEVAGGAVLYLEGTILVG